MQESALIFLFHLAESLPCQPMFQDPGMIITAAALYLGVVKELVSPPICKVYEIENHKQRAKTDCKMQIHLCEISCVILGKSVSFQSVYSRDSSPTFSASCPFRFSLTACALSSQTIRSMLTLGNTTYIHN